MNAAQPDLDDLILRIHSSALDLDGWRSVVSDLAGHLHAETATLLFQIGSAGKEPPWGLYHNSDPVGISEYAAHWSTEDPWYLGSRRRHLTAEGAVHFGDQMIDRHELRQTAFYNEFLNPWGMEWMINVCLADEQARARGAAALSFFRGKHKGEFTCAESEKLRVLSRHLVVAAKNLMRAVDLSLYSAIQTNALDKLTNPVLVIDRTRRVLLSNQAAEQLLSDSEWLCVVGGRLTAAASLYDARACAQVLSDLCDGRGGELLLLDHVTGRQAVMTTTPLSVSVTNVRAVMGGLVWVVPNHPNGSPVDELTRLFGLTPAEGRLLRQLIDSENLADAADVLDLSQHTVRNQLKAIFRKTGVRNQAQLHGMVGRMAVVKR